MRSYKKQMNGYAARLAAKSESKRENENKSNTHEYKHYERFAEL